MKDFIFYTVSAAIIIFFFIKTCIIWFDKGCIEGRKEERVKLALSSTTTGLLTFRVESGILVVEFNKDQNGNIVQCVKDKNHISYKQNKHSVRNEEVESADYLSSVDPDVNNSKKKI
jgi:hypothetical protein